MSLYGMMRTGASGMNAQANRLGTVADNIANASTTGYKRAQSEFASLILPSTAGSYNSGGVVTHTRYAISQEGTLDFTTSDTDLAISGAGFFIVSDSTGQPFLTRAGSFVPDADGNLVNAAGYTLMGHTYAEGLPAPVVNGYDGLEQINVSSGTLSALPSTFGAITANLDASEDIVAAADLPSTNSANAEFTHKNSLVAYDNLGSSVLLDFYYSKTADNTWEVAVYNRADASPNTSFPYTAGPMATSTLAFNPTTGTVPAGTTISLAVPNGATLEIDLSDLTQLDYDFTIGDGTSINGNQPSPVESVQIGDDGIVYAQFNNGQLKPIYRLALANVPSPDQLRPLQGNVYQESPESGVIRTGFPGTGDFGDIVSGALEASNVDIANELTDMIESQRSYTANSKVFQTGSDLMDVLVNLKR